MWQISFFLLRGERYWNKKPRVTDKGGRARHYRDSRRGSCWGPTCSPPPVLWASQSSLGRAVLWLVGTAGSRQLQGDKWGEVSPGAPAKMAAASASRALGPSHTITPECSKYCSLIQLKPEEIVQMMILTQNVIVF